MLAPQGLDMMVFNKDDVEMKDNHTHYGPTVLTKCVSVWEFNCVIDGVLVVDSSRCTPARHLDEQIPTLQILDI